MPNIKQVFSQEVFSQMRNFLDNMSRASKATEEFEELIGGIRTQSQQAFEAARATLTAYTDTAKGSIRQQEAQTKAAMEYVKVLKELDTIQTSYTTQLLRLQGVQKYLQSVEGSEAGKSIASAKQRIANQEALWRATDKLAGSTQLLEKNLRSIRTPEGQRNAVLKERLKIVTSLATAEERARGAVNLERAKGVEGVRRYTQELAVQKEINKANAQAATFLQRRQNATSELRRELERISTVEGKQEIILAEQVKNQKAIVVEEQKRLATVSKLRRELTYLNSAQGQEELALRRAIAETKRLETAKAGLNRQFRIGHQLTTAFRAGLHGLRTSIGMYTSATILTATAMYGLSRSFRSGIEVGTQFTAEMQKTESIMNALGQDKSFGALEAQVLSLGRSTQFTMTQVASAATELGKIGLSAREATEALAPVLNLSIIGDMGLADSAKTATDIMLLFNKEASELGHVVDVMAAAVTNSSASIGQLTNALSYAGASAHAAGFQFEEVVAAEMALANAGIRGSIAGTALRRAFTNLLNPTRKGAQVLDQFGIVAADAFGNTRDLQSIFGELSERLNDLPEEEKIQALSDLFGVRAASPMAALLGNIKGFNKALGELEGSFGMADAMMDKMRDAFKFDVLEVTSAMEAMYTQVFQNNEMQLRVWAQQLRSAIDYMAEPLEDGRIRIEAWGSAVATTLKVVLAGWLAFRSAKVARAFYTPTSETTKLTLEVEKLTAAQGHAVQNTNLHTQAITAQGHAAQRTASQLAILGRVRASQTGGSPRTAGWVTASSTQSKASSAAGVSMTSAVLSAGRGVTALLGHVGMLISVGFLIYEGVSLLRGVVGNQEDKLKNTEAELRKQYDAMKEETRRREEDRALDSREAIHSNRAYVESLQRQLAEIVGITEAYNLQGSAAEAAAEKKAKIESEIENTLEQQKVLIKEFQKIDVDDPMSEVVARRLYRNVEDTNYAVQKRLEILRKENTDLDSLFKEQEKIIEERERRRAEIEAKYLRQRQDVSRKYVGAYDPKKASALAAINKEETKELEELERVPARLVELSSLIQDTVQNVLGQTYSKEVTGEVKTLQDLLDEMKKVRDHELLETVDRARARTMGPLEQLMQAQREYDAQLAVSMQSQAEMVALIKEHGESLLGLEGLEGERLSRQIAQEKQSGLTRREMEKLNETHKALINLEWQIAAQGANLNRTLKQSYDNLAAAREDNSNKVYQLTVAYKNGALPLREFQSALGELNVEMLEAERRNDEVYQSMLRLRNSWGNKELEERVLRQEDLNRALERGAINAEQWRRETNKMQPSYDPVSMSANLPNTVVTGVYNTAVERAKGFSELDYRKETAEHEFGLQELALQEERREAALELQRKYQVKGLEESDEYLNALTELNARYDTLEKTGKAEHLAEMEQMDRNYLSFRNQANLMMVASTADMLSGISNAIYQSAEEGSRTQKASFAAMKTLAVASILINTEVAAMGAMAASLNGGNVGGLVAGPTMVKFIRAMGYTSAGLVAGMAIAQGPRGDNSAGMFDRGGSIPRGQWGIVGEYGPEIVEGPARVTSRKNTAHRLGGGVTIAPVIQVDYQSAGGGTEEDGMEIAQIVKGIVIDVIRDQLRSNGLLSRS